MLGPSPAHQPICTSTGTTQVKELKVGHSHTHQQSAALRHSETTATLGPRPVHQRAQQTSVLALAPGPRLTVHWMGTSPEIPWSLAQPTRRLDTSPRILQWHSLLYQDTTHPPASQHQPWDPWSPAMPTSTSRAHIINKMPQQEETKLMDTLPVFTINYSVQLHHSIFVYKATNVNTERNLSWRSLILI